MKLLIAGGRTFNSYTHMCDVIKSFNLDITEIVDGGANGTDKLAELYAFEHDIKNTTMLAEWDTKGKSAGYIRNKQMADYLNEEDMVLCFWNGISKGTKHMIDISLKLKLKTFIVFY